MPASALRLLTAIHPLHGKNPSPDELAEQAKLAEASGVDRVLVGYSSPNPDGWIVASYILANTTTLKVLLAHRPGVMHPVIAARQAATLSYASRGRLAINIVSGGSPSDQAREGDSLEHDARYVRAEEYVTAMRKLWAATEPISHDGEYYQYTRALLKLRPWKDEPIEIFMGGASPAALDFGIKSANTYMLWGEPLTETKERLDEIRARANELEIPVDSFSMSFRLVLGKTSEEAWARADAILEKYEDQSNRVIKHDQDVGRSRQLDIARANTRHDTNFWSGITLAMAGLGSTSALVGTEDEIVASLAEYRRIGIDTLLLTGPDGVWSEDINPVIARVQQELR